MDLHWALAGPGLLSSVDPRVVPDSEFLAGVEKHAGSFQALAADPAPLQNFLKARVTHGRLGRYFEHLLQFYLICLEQVPRLEANLQIREEKRTLGELDLVFTAGHGTSPQHWEASVKFWLCTTTDPLESREERFFMGTLVEDRMDLKLTKLLERQLALVTQPTAAEKLASLNLAEPLSRAVLKGWLFYPCQIGWASHPHPPSISANHSRGWWTTAAALQLPSEKSRYVVLPPARWLSPYVGNELELRKASDMRAYIQKFFEGVSSLSHELMLAEVETTPDGVREISRGHVVHADWPSLAREAALK